MIKKTNLSLNTTFIEEDMALRAICLVGIAQGSSGAPSESTVLLGGSCGLASRWRTCFCKHLGGIKIKGGKKR